MISIHAAREGGDRSAVDDLGAILISIHAAREGGDALSRTQCGFALEFQSTPPVKAATADDAAELDGMTISIHAAREGGDGTVRNAR